MVYYTVGLSSAQRLNASEANYGTPSWTIGLPSTIHNDNKRFIKMFVQQAFISADIPATAEGSHICIQLVNPTPLHNIMALQNGYNWCGELGMAGLFQTQTGATVFNYERHSDSQYVIMSKEQFLGLTQLDFKFFVDGREDGVALQPNNTKQRIYHIILGFETLDEIQ